MPGGPDRDRTRAMEALLARLATLPAREALVLRGGMLTRRWYPPGQRTADDLDFLALDGFDPDRLLERIGQLGPVLRWEIIWAETDNPGLRAWIDVDGVEVQVDVATGDPLVPPPVQLDGLWTPRRELMMAWKLHGLFERADGYWRPKDLADLWAIGQFAPVDPGALQQAIRAAFTSRGTPFRVADRLVEGTFGRSASSGRTWRRYGRDKPWLPELSVALDAIRANVVPALVALRGPPLDRFPTLEALDPILPVAQDAGFAVYRHPDCTVLTYERQGPDSFPRPGHAPTFDERRRRLILRECRGLTFDRTGRIAARKLHKFFNLPERQDLPDETLVLEKLDGSMVTALELDGELVVHTRRGPSDIATGARALLPGEFCREALADGLTPVFEWCWTLHRIVIRHPEDRLVLLALRHLRTGEYLPDHELRARADAHGVQVVPLLGRWSDRDWRAEVAGWEGREGIVLRTPDDGFWKLKSPWYRTAHRAVEGPERQRARFRLILEGRASLLSDLDLPIDAPLLDYRAALAQRVQALVDGETDRKALAARAADRPRLERAAAFRVVDGEPLQSAVDAVLLLQINHKGGWTALLEDL